MRNGVRETVTYSACIILEIGALGDAEAVLLIDDDESEIFEANVFLNNRVRTDEDIDHTGLQCGEEGCSRDGLSIEELIRLREEGYFRMGVLKEFRECLIVLPREDFSRCEESGLEVLLCDDTTGDRCDRCFPRSDITIEKSVHRLCLREGGEDFCRGSFLCGSEFEWKF